MRRDEPIYRRDLSRSSKFDSSGLVLIIEIQLVFQVSSGDQFFVLSTLGFWFRHTLME